MQIKFYRKSLTLQPIFNLNLSRSYGKVFIKIRVNESRGLLPGFRISGYFSSPDLLRTEAQNYENEGKFVLDCWKISFYN